MKLSVIVPVFNEVKTIKEILKKVEDVNIDKEIIVIDDYSTDGTRDILKRLNRKYKIFFQDENKGKGSAVKIGFDNSIGDIIIIQDADLEYNPEEYPKLLEPILSGKSSVVYGSRFLNMSHIPRYRLFYLGNIFLSFLSSILYGQKITDMETCYKVFKREVIKDVKIKADRFDFEPEITAKIIKAGYKIKEVPIDYKSRSFEEGKKIGWRDGVKAIWILVKYRFKE